SEFQYSTDGGQTWIDAAGDDHDLVTIPAGSTSILVRVDTVNDSTEESIEAFRVEIDGVTTGSAEVAGGDAGNNGFGGTGEADIAANDHKPSITSNSSFSLDENSTNVATLTATDQDPSNTLSWSIDQGDDGAKFKIDATSGALSFVTPPNFEAANDV